MNVLLVSVSCPPKNSPESFQTGRYLRHISHHANISVVTTRATGGWEPYDNSLLKYLDGVKQIVNVPQPHPKIIGALRKFIPSFLFPDEARFFPGRYKSVLRQITKPDLIFSRAAPFSSTVMGLRLATSWNVPWIAHFSDPWADSPFLKIDNATYERHDRLERQCISQARLVTLTSNKTVELYRMKYPQYADKFRFLPNVFDEQDVSQAPMSFRGKAKFVFTGRLYGSRVIHHLMDGLDEAVRLRPELLNECEFILAGFFTQENIDRIKKSDLPNVKVPGSLSMDESIAIQRSAAVLILIDAIDDTRHDIFFLSKLLDYMAARRRVLAITGDHSTTREVVESKFGTCFGPSNLNALPAHIIECVSRFKDSDTAFFTPAADIMEYSSETNSQRLLSYFEEAVQS